MPLLFLLLFLIPLLAGGQPGQTWILDVNVVDVESGRVIPGQTVVLEGSRIKAVGRKGRPGPGARVIQGAGKYLIPGLCDFYAAVCNYEYNREEALSLFLAAGVTSVRDLQPTVPLAYCRQLKEDIASGKKAGPRIYTVSHLITLKGRREKKVVAQHPSEGEAAVDTAVAAGVDVIKLDNTLAPEVLKAVIARAHRSNKLVIGGYTTPFIDAAEAGVDMIDHASDLRRVTTVNRQRYFDFYTKDSSRLVSRDEFYNRVLPSLGGIDSAYFRQTIAAMKKNNTWLLIGPASQMPSILKFEINDTSRLRYKSARQRAALLKAAEENSKVAALDRYKNQVDLTEIRWAHQLGLPIVAGSQMYDYMTPGLSLHDSFYWMQEAGFQPIEILRTATINPARFLKRDKELGSVRKGKLADLVLLNSNPLLNITNLLDIHIVFANGRQEVKLPTSN